MTESSRASQPPTDAVSRYFGANPAERWLFAATLMAAVFAAYFPAWHGGFVWDDNSHISEDQPLRSLHGLWQIWFQPGATCQYYPLTFSIFWAEFQLWGLNTLGYHLVNILLHGVVSILLWQVLDRLKVRGAWLAGAIFALHPVGVMSVAWMTELKNTLSATLALLAGWAYIRAVGLGAYEDGRARLVTRFYALALVLFGLAMFAKTAVSFLPVTLLLVTWWYGRKLTWNAVWPVLPMFAVAVAMGLLTIHVEQSPMGGATGERFNETYVQRILISGRSFWFYLEKLFLPTPAPFIYPRWNVDPHVWWQCLFPIATIAALVGSWLLPKRFGRGLFTGLMHFYVSTSLLVLIVVLYFTNFSFVSDHWQYFGCMSVIALAAAGVMRVLDLFKNALLEAGLCAALLALLATLTWHQCGMYKDIDTLWAVTLQRNPDCSMAHNYYAGALFKKGDAAGAIEHLREALRIQPDSYEAHNNLGSALLQTGHVDEAVAEIQKATQLKPDFDILKSNLRNALFLSNVWQLATSPDASIRNGQRAVELAEQANQVAAGKDPVVLGELAAAYAEAGRFSDAVRMGEQAIPLASRLDAGLAGALRGQVAGYKTNHAFRDPRQQGPAGGDRR